MELPCEGNSCVPPFRAFLPFLGLLAFPARLGLTWPATFAVLCLLPSLDLAASYIRVIRRINRGQGHCPGHVLEEKVLHDRRGLQFFATTAPNIAPTNKAVPRLGHQDSSESLGERGGFHKQWTVTAYVAYLYIGVSIEVDSEPVPQGYKKLDGSRHLMV